MNLKESGKPQDRHFECMFERASATRTRLAASDPNSRSSLFQATDDCIFLLESLFKRTSKGKPGFIKEALIQSEP